MRTRLRLIPTTFIMLTSLWGIPETANAQIVQATTSIEGLTCPFCSFGAQKRLKKVGGVKDVKVDVNLGLATLFAGQGQSIDVQQIPDAVKKAGFVPDDIRVVAIGMVQDNSGQLYLQLRGQEQGLLLADADPTTSEKLRGFAGSGVEIEVTGAWNSASGGNSFQITPGGIQLL